MKYSISSFYPRRKIVVINAVTFAGLTLVYISSVACRRPLSDIYIKCLSLLGLNESISDSSFDRKIEAVLISQNLRMVRASSMKVVLSYSRVPFPTANLHHPLARFFQGCEVNVNKHTTGAMQIH